VKKTEVQESDDKAKLETFRKKLVGKWEARGDGGQTIFVEFRADGTSRGHTVINGQRHELEGRWEALRLEGEKVIVKSTVEGTTVELPYWFVSDDEYHYVSPRGQTIKVRRSKGLIP
jgi:hypothetical protein